MEDMASSRCQLRNLPPFYKSDVDEASQSRLESRTDSRDRVLSSPERAPSIEIEVKESFPGGALRQPIR